MRISLRTKLLIFAIAIAIMPLAVAGRAMIRIAQDELKSSANEQLSGTARELVDEIDDLYRRAWLAPLVLIRNAIDDERLDIEQKISLLTLGIADIPDIVALQVTVEGAGLPLVVAQDRFAERLRKASLDPLGVLRVPATLIEIFRQSDDDNVREIRHVPQTGDWLATVVLPLTIDLGGGPASLSARIDLSRMRQFMRNHRFNLTGVITIVDADGRQVFDQDRTDLGEREIVKEATELLAVGSRSISVEPYARPDGEVMLGALAFPGPLPWAILVEKRQRDAYLAVEKMLRSLGVWALFGLAVAVAGALVLALRISRPILRIGRIANEVAKGNFEVRVEGVRTRDEVGELARRINDMIVGLNERFQLAKFVSGETMSAIRGADRQGVRLGGEKRDATMLFCDIRGYTAFAERRDPEEVVEALNYYLQRQADTVVKHHGDIDKFVGDQIVAVFQGEGMVENAVRCALEIQAVTDALGREHPERGLEVGIGVDCGEVIMGAMGSRDRMDYTVLGDHVNLAARLCSHAGPGQTLLSENAKLSVVDHPEFSIRRLETIVVKGKSEPVPIYEARPHPTVSGSAHLA